MSAHGQIGARRRGSRKRVWSMQRKRGCSRIPRGRDGAEGLRVMKTRNPPMGPGSRAFRKCQTASLQGIVSSQGVHWRGGGMRGPRATWAMARSGPSGDVLFGCRAGAGGGSHRTDQQKPAASHKLKATSVFIVVGGIVKGRLGPGPTWPRAKYSSSGVFIVSIHRIS